MRGSRPVLVATVAACSAAVAGVVGYRAGSSPATITAPVAPTRPTAVPTPSPSTIPIAAPIAEDVRWTGHRDPDSGLFLVEAVVGGRRTGVRFALDTGAETTIVRERDAAALGLVPTATGEADVVVVGSVLPMKGGRIPAMAIAGTDLSDVRALMGPDTLPFSLLGQDAIARLGAVSFDGDRVTVSASRADDSMD